MDSMWVEASVLRDVERDSEYSFNVMMEMLKVEMDVQATAQLKTDGLVQEVLLTLLIDVPT